MKVVDPHMHLCNFGTIPYPWLEHPRTDYFLSPYDALARFHDVPAFLQDADGIEVLKVVHVENSPAPEERITETRWLQSLADDPDSCGMPNGIVAAIDLSAPDVERTLTTYQGFPAMRGVRQMLNVHENPFYNYVGCHFMGNPTWQSGFRSLSQFGFSFDLHIYPSQMREAAALARSNSNTTVILNHTGMFVDRDTLTGWRNWRDGIRILAACSTVMVKISGMGMLDHNWTIESIRPYVLETIDHFGIDRCMFASNFPVDGLYGSYSDLWNAYHACVAGFTETEKEKLFRANAERIYRI